MTICLSNNAKAQSLWWMPQETGIEVFIGGLPASLLSAVVRTTQDIGVGGVALRFARFGYGGGWRLRAGVMMINLHNGNYLVRGHGYDDVHYVWFSPVRFGYLQVDRCFDMAHIRAWTGFVSIGAAVGVLSGSLRMQKAQGCRTLNWDHPDTDPTWGGCYHDPDPYGSDTYVFPPAGGFLHVALGMRRYVIRDLLTILEIGLFLPGFAGISLAFEWNFR